MLACACSSSARFFSHIVVSVVCVNDANDTTAAANALYITLYCIPCIWSDL
jgi:hypothetical protein